MTEKTGLIYLQKDKFDFYQPSLAKIIEFRFIPEIVRDLDVVNVELFENLIRLFIANNKILPSDLIIVLSDSACFIKDFIPSVTPPKLPQDGQAVKNPVVVTPQDTESRLQNQIKHFIEHVPFDNVSSKVFPMGNGTKVLATNQDLFECVKTSFEKGGFKIDLVLPGIVFDNSISQKTILDINAANTFLQTADTKKEDSLMLTKTFKPEPEPKQNSDTKISSSEKAPEKKINKRLFIMIGIFVILIIILIFVYISSQQKPA